MLRILHCCYPLLRLVSMLSVVWSCIIDETLKSIWPFPTSSGDEHLLHELEPCYN